ncbi:MAG: ABC transporter permease [Gammaproteobacteria bacterium]|jgi:NitT/TauT family transport system permease protein|nr:ABC transporter permease [Gammaproteobacteria bacterium]
MGINPAVLGRFGSVSGVALLCALLALWLPWSGTEGVAVSLSGWQQIPWLVLVLIVTACALLGMISARHKSWGVWLVTALTLLSLWLVTDSVQQADLAGQAAFGFWLLVIAIGCCMWVSMSGLAAIKLLHLQAQGLINLLIPVLLGIWVISLWELVVVGFAIPHVLLPAPSVVGEAIMSSIPTLAADFNQTVIKAVIPGFLLGNSVGFLVAVLADKVPFLRRGLLPVGNLVSAIPIVGVAPIMVMWFGFDWQSKVAVVVIMTFFPMLVNTITGLAESDAIERDLMRSYGASYWQSLVKLRLPNALPFIFNALKISSTLALIGAIVAEFFGTPIVGMGFRISTEVGRMNIEMVWASIAVAALAGSCFYGLLALLERRITFWHASFRRGHG